MFRFLFENKLHRKMRLSSSSACLCTGGLRPRILLMFQKPFVIFWKLSFFCLFYTKIIKRCVFYNSHMNLIHNDFTFLAIYQIWVRKMLSIASVTLTIKTAHILTCVLTLMLTHMFTHVLTHALTHMSTHMLTYVLTHIPSHLFQHAC